MRFGRECVYLCRWGLGKNGSKVWNVSLKDGEIDLRVGALLCRRWNVSFGLVVGSLNGDGLNVRLRVMNLMSGVVLSSGSLLGIHIEGESLSLGKLKCEDRL